jgi:hypothetical protein
MCRRCAKPTRSSTGATQSSDGETVRVFAAAQGYADFDQGAARKFVIDPHGFVWDRSLSTEGSHGQWNTTLPGLDDRYRGVFGGRDVIFVSVADAR